MKIRTGDNVIMLAGKDRGKDGKVLRVFPKEEKVIVEGLNMVKKHQRPKKQGQKGGVISVPMPVDSSNVMIVCRHCKKAARMGIKRESEKAVLICKKCKAEN